METENNGNKTEKHVHVYDGIVEQNNPMPSWWVWLFILCIIFAFIYWIHYFSNGVTLRDEYNEAFKAYQAEVEKAASVAQVETEESLSQYMRGEVAIANGAAIFASKCAMCHGESLQGKIGPNLTDNFWTTGDGSRVAVLHTITKGSSSKGMPAWETMLKPKEIKDVASFVYSKIGSNPQNPKPPEGKEVKK